MCCCVVINLRCDSDLIYSCFLHRFSNTPLCNSKIINDEYADAGGGDDDDDDDVVYYRITHSTARSIRLLTLWKFS